MIGRLISLLFLLLAASTPVAADVFKPAYLELRQTGPDTYGVLWRVPALDETTTIDATPVFPGGTLEMTPRRSTFAEGTTALRWTARVPGGLEGRTIRFDQREGATLDVLVRLERSDGSAEVEMVLPSEAEISFRPSPGPMEVAETYLSIGIVHILGGIDHLLFIAALVLLVRGRRRLFWTITAFTIAHSITLALATLGFVDLPGPPVEAAIALSIVFVSLEVLRRQARQPSLGADKPWLIGFSFGLLHGLGFAGALAEVGLPRDSIPLALLFFNIGVEIGQLIFVAALLLLAAGVKRVTGGLDQKWAVTVPAYAIGATASLWLFERITALA